MTSRVQNNGLARITAALITLNWWLQWGTGSAAAATANAITVGTSTEARSSATATQQTTTVTNDTLQLVATITALTGTTGTPLAITEVGAFDAAGTGGPATGGNLDIYSDFPALNLVAGDSIAFTLKTKFS